LGKPASSINLTKQSNVRGTALAGLTTTVLPAKSAGTIFADGM